MYLVLVLLIEQPQQATSYIVLYLRTMTLSDLKGDDEELLQSIREKTNAILNSLEINRTRTPPTASKDDTATKLYESWIRGKIQLNEDDSKEEQGEQYWYPTANSQYFDTNGFLLLPSFCDSDEIQRMKDDMKSLVQEQWDPNHGSTNNAKNEDDDTKKDDDEGDADENDKDKNLEEQQKKGISVFRTDEKQVENQGSDDYFLSSADKIHFFAESKAIDKESNTLKSKYNSENKMLALNKAGHGMHMMKGNTFHSYTTSDKIYDIVHELGWKDPVVPQSMYIFKQAHVGAEVTSHQDSTFLYTAPKQSCLGLWLALDDATLTNGCLWVRPKSHKEKVRRIFQRNIEYFGADSIRCRSNVARGDLTKSQMIFTNEVASTPIPWDGKIPGWNSSVTSNDNDIDNKEEEEDDDDDDDENNDEKLSSLPWNNLFDAGFVPIECKAGDLVVFPGELDHLSLPNYSKHQRHTFQLHLVEGERAGVKWSEMNWLQYPEGVPFLRLNSKLRSNS